VKKLLLLALPLAGLLMMPLSVALVVAGSSPANGDQLAPESVPQKYADGITAAAASCPGVSAPVLGAQLQVESGWNLRALSPAGAQGLAQFLPATWTAYGVDAPAPYSGDGIADVWNPYDAIFSAARYDCALASMVAAVPGDSTALTLAAYNAGPFAVLRYGGVPPYPETQRYVAAILELAAQFGASGTVPPADPAATAVAFAQSKLGLPYQYGGTGPLYDCSGLTQAAWAAGGVHLPRTSQEQWYAGRRVGVADLQAGDLVFYANDVRDPSSIHHVGLYVRDGQMIESPYTGAFVRYAAILPRPDYIGAVRPLIVPPR